MARCRAPASERVLCCRNASRRRQAMRQPLHCGAQPTIMDKARQVLARGVSPGVRRSYRTLEDHGGVARSTLHRRDHGGPSKEDKAGSQLYLTPWEESALVKCILHLSDLGQPVRIKYIPSLTFVATRARPPADNPPSLRARTGQRLSRNATQRQQRDRSRR